jgi:hypothetical protein
MSKHTSRKSRWTQVDAKEYRATCGVVRYRAGAWEGAVHYELLDTESADAVLVWHPATAPAGRFKRPRNAMISVEDKAKEIARRYQDKVRFTMGGSP